jgi:hypothetical protein
MADFNAKDGADRSFSGPEFCHGEANLAQSQGHLSLRAPVKTGKVL